MISECIDELKRDFKKLEDKLHYISKEAHKQDGSYERALIDQKSYNKSVDRMVIMWETLGNLNPVFKQCQNIDNVIAMCKQINEEKSKAEEYKIHTKGWDELREQEWKK